VLVITDPFLPRLLFLKKLFLEELYLRLFKNDHTPTPDNDEDDFVEADFPGYAPLDGLTFFAPFLNDDGDGQMNSETHVWECTSPSNPNSIYGYYATDAYGRVVYAERVQGDPVPMTDTGELFPLTIRWYERRAT